MGPFCQLLKLIIIIIIIKLAAPDDRRQWGAARGEDGHGVRPATL